MRKPGYYVKKCTIFSDSISGNKVFNTLKISSRHCLRSFWPVTSDVTNSLRHFNVFLIAKKKMGSNFSKTDLWNISVR